MTFHWVADVEGGEPIRSQEFPTRADAEAWLTESYEELIEDGASAVTLFEEGSLVYGPMSLFE